MSDDTVPPQFFGHLGTQMLSRPEAFFLFCGMLLTYMTVQAVVLNRHGNFRHACHDVGARLLLAREPFT